MQLLFYPIKKLEFPKEKYRRVSNDLFVSAVNTVPYRRVPAYSGEFPVAQAIGRKKIIKQNRDQIKARCCRSQKIRDGLLLQESIWLE